MKEDKSTLFKTLLLILIVFFIPNFYAYFKFLFSNKYQMDLQIFNLDSYFLNIALIIQVVTFIIVIFFAFLNKKNVKPIKIEQKKYGMIVLVIQSLFFLVNVIYQANRAGSEQSNMPWYISYIFILLLPDSLTLIYLFVADKSKLKTINILVFITSNLSRGWMGAFMYLIVLIFLENKIKVKSVISLTISFLLLIASMPLILKAKWYFRSESNSLNFFDFISMMSVSEYIHSLSTTFDYILIRLQNLSTLIYLLSNNDRIEASHFLPFWAEGNLQLIFVKLFNISLPTLNSYIVEHLMGYSNVQWSVQTGLGSLLIINPIIFIAMLIYIFILIRFLNILRISNHSYLIQSFIIYIIFSRLFYGWYASFFNFILSFILTSIIIFLIRDRKNE
ncbi:TPA: oligosaccharide repeat unit polymerase [Photobacterium damselae]|uniref:oligosaccharide repeat unit polymerase n=1 Tax=Photobacterium damselae TaxID=38293 RepID=UPI00370A3133